MSLLYSHWGLLLAFTTAAGLSVRYCLLLLAVKRIDQNYGRPKGDEVKRSRLGEALKRSLPDCVFFEEHPEMLMSIQSYWTMQQREMYPELVIKPRNDQEVSMAVIALKENYDQANTEGSKVPMFAVRSGGHFTVPGGSNAEGGTVIDLSLLNFVEPAEDGKSVAIGPGARWYDVSSKLDDLNLSVAGGRNSDVGVAGLALGGGFSFFSPRVGFVCDNVLSFTVVLASGAIVVASQSEHKDLWRGLKGGSNNFGVVTRLTLRSFPSTKVWSGFLYMLPSKAPQCITAFYNFVKGPFDPYAAGPLLCFSYVQSLRIRAIAPQIIYTKPEAWPACWQEFKSIGRLWSTTKIRTLTSATNELDSSSPAGFRQLHITTTIVNDHRTLEFTHQVYNSTINCLRKVKGMIWTLVLQPLPRSTMRNGDDNVLGLGDREEPRVIVLFTAVWKNKSDDELVNKTGREAIEEIDIFAKQNGTADRFRYLNWSAGNQDPIESYGPESVKLLQSVSEMYDPEGFFQRACAGPFKVPHTAPTKKAEHTTLPKA